MREVAAQPRVSISRHSDRRSLLQRRNCIPIRSFHTDWPILAEFGTLLPPSKDSCHRVRTTATEQGLLPPNKDYCHRTRTIVTL